LALDRIGQDAVDAKIGVDETTKKPRGPMINAGAIAAASTR
jgi:glutaminase